MEHRTYIEQRPDGWHWRCTCGSRGRKPLPTVNGAIKLTTEHRSVVRRGLVTDVPAVSPFNLRRYLACEAL